MDVRLAPTGAERRLRSTEQSVGFRSIEQVSITPLYNITVQGGRHENGGRSALLRLLEKHEKFD